VSRAKKWRRVRPEFHIDCYMILLPSATGGGERGDGGEGGGGGEPWHSPRCSPASALAESEILK